MRYADEHMQREGMSADENVQHVRRRYADGCMQRERMSADEYVQHG